MNKFLGIGKAAIRNFLYAFGILALIHKFRNRNTLTILMFHRVLPVRSDAYAVADKEFTFSVDGFVRSLEFLQLHYNLISFTELEQANKTSSPLPARAALITFDDGWLDTIKFAYPELKKRGLSGLIFVASEVLESKHALWWQDCLVSAMGNPSNLKNIETALGLGKPQHEHDLIEHRIASTLASLPEEARLAHLEKYVNPGKLPRQMVRREDFATIDLNVMEIGGHGHTHAPLTIATDPANELRESFKQTMGLSGKPAMSFPHGRFNAEIVQLAQQAGFTSLFTSNPSLTTTKQLKLPRLLGRIHVPENEWTCEDGTISFPKLAMYLFFRPIDAPSRATPGS